MSRTVAVIVVVVVAGFLLAGTMQRPICGSQAHFRLQKRNGDIAYDCIRPREHLWAKDGMCTEWYDPGFLDDRFGRVHST